MLWQNQLRALPGPAFPVKRHRVTLNCSWSEQIVLPMGSDWALFDAYLRGLTEGADASYARPYRREATISLSSPPALLK